MSDTPLAKKIKRLIEANGPISISQYMAICLGDPEYGYYITREPIGAAGDFITAPEVSQMFGEIVGAWLVHAWRLAGSPSPVRLVELGPGRGTLMADILRVAKGVPEFRAATSVYLVEQSPVLRAPQAAMLKAASVHPTWLTDFGQVPEGPLLLVANEFFDALPIRQFLLMDEVWRERVVGLDVAGELAFGIGGGPLEEFDTGRFAAGPPPSQMGEGDHAKHGGGGGHIRRVLHSPPPPPSAVPLPRSAGEEPVAASPDPLGPSTEFLEVRPAAEALVREIAGRIARDGGAALIVDYGYERRGAGGDTLQAVRKHAFADPLSAPGEADLTAHVDFAALSASVHAAGAIPHGRMAQGDFLLALGLRERATKLAESADEATRNALDAAVARLTGAEQMGKLFKVLAITQHGMDVPPFAAVI